MSSQPNHYEALGLPVKATAEQIKKKYRELARLYHPDVNSTAEAARRILAVNQAYGVLGDAQRRATYDAERAIRAAAPRSTAASSGHPRAGNPAAHPTFRTQGPSGSVRYDGFGRSYSQPGDDSGPARAPEWNAPPRRPQKPRTSSTEAILSEAKLAYINRQYPLAQRLCNDALALNPREAVAHEILGDVFTRQGDMERAIMALGYAIQFNPANQGAQAKLNRLMQASDSQPFGPKITFAGRAEKATAPPKTPDTGMAFVSTMAGGALVLAPTLIAIYPGTSSADPLGMLFGLSFNLLISLVIAGLAGGVLLAFYGRMRPFTEEAWNRSRYDSAKAPIPLGIILAIFGIIWFYGSFLVYIGISSTKNRFSPSILRSYAATLALVLVFTLAYHPPISSPGWVAAVWGGNILFPSVLFGWLFGDAIRLRGRM